MKEKLLTAIILFSYVALAQAVDIQSRKLNTYTGLPENNVRNLAVDDKGFIWFGTPNGLYRYDGYFFNTYRFSDEGNLRLLNNNHIVGLRVRGRLVVVREQGNLFSVFDTHQNRFVAMEGKKQEALFKGKVTKWQEHPLMTPYQTVIRQGGTVIEDNMGNPVVVDNTGLIWHVDRKTGETVSLRVFDEKLFPLVSSHKYKVCLSHDGRLLWVSTNGCGITLYDRKMKTAQQIRQLSGLISTDYILDMCLDGNDNVWVADEFHGVVCLSVATGHGENHLLVADSDELRGNQVYILQLLPDGRLLTANTKGHVWFVDGTTLAPSTDGANIDMHSVCCDRDGGLWIGTRQQGLQAPNGMWYRHDEAAVASISSNNIYSLLCDRDGRIWVAGEDAPLDLAVRQQDGNYAFRHVLNKRFTIRVMVQDHEGQVWLGTRSGLFRFRPDELLKNGEAYTEVLSASETRYSDVSSIYEDSHHRLWIGTLGGGVFVRENGTFRNLTTAEGLISNEVHSLVEDGRGIMWIATNRGITCLNPGDGSCHYISDNRNPLHNYFTDNCVCRLTDGRLAFGTNHGIMVYQPGKDASDLGRGKVALAITDLLVNGVSVSNLHEESPIKVSPDDVEELDLAHDQNSLTFHFSTFNMAESADTRYSYFLEGYDLTWSEPSAYSFASYKNLSPGKYVLHVKAYSNHSQENSIKKVSIVIHHPWWATWWAYLAYLILAVALGYGLYHQLRTIYSLRRRISIEKELTEYKLLFFTNISHEFRTPLTIIRSAIERIRSIREIPADLRQPISNMSRGTDRMLRLVNQLMEFRKMQAGRLRLSLEDTDIVGFVRNIYQNFSDLAENKRINYTFSSNVKSQVIPLDRQHIDKVVYNLLSNAFKYTPANGSISVSLMLEKQNVTIAVRDTGVGISKEKQPELFQRFMQSTFASDSIGIGLHLSKALVEVHHGNIHFEENLPQGSVFVVELPAGREIYQTEDFLQQSELEPTAISEPSHAYMELIGEPMNDRTILVVEDDTDILTMLKQTLGRYFHVSVAMNGATALDMLNEGPVPDLIVSDVMMPVMDGYELTRRVRCNPATQTVPIVLLTALTNDDKRLKGIEQGADAYLTKPFETRLLISTCRQIIEQRDRLRHQAADVPETTPAALPEIIVEERDKQLLDIMNAWILRHISDPMLSVDRMAEAMGYRRSIFFKKVKALTGQTPADYIKTLRMNRAAELLRSETITVAEVCYQVGISDPHYFTKVFKQKFGISPKKYQQGKYQS